MYLKRLEMLGFKSFAVRTVLEFSTGITAVVGPNGAGKSNVADAMRWVLGEQSMRQLRGKKSDDIIFAGGHGKAALGMAEVALTLDNSTGWVPSEYSEITVARRSYRSGENEYLMNKQRVRLRDVVLLLAQARIGHDSYTVVGQGLIDAALSLRPEERRGLFEDAAGIRPFQVQRLDAENRLRQTELNLERLCDIVAELEPRLAPLKEQAQRAVEYQHVSGELQEALLAWYALQWRRLRSSRERAEAAEQQQAQRVQQMEQALASADQQSDLLRAQRQHAHVQIAEARKVWSEANASVQRIERQLAVSEERITSYLRQRAEQQGEERRLRERLLALQQQAIDAEEHCDLADEAVDTGATTLATLEAQVTRAQKEYELDERRLRGAQHDLIQVQARLGASQTDLGRQHKHLGERNRTLSARRETIASAQQTLRTLETRLLEERSRLELAQREEQEVVQRKQALGRTFADTQQEIERLKMALGEAERLRRTVSDRLNMLKNWRQNLSGYSEGVRALLRAPADKVRGLLGPVPQLAVAVPGMETALEAALGPYVQAVVVETMADAHLGLHYLQTTKAGKALIIWLETGQQDGVAEEQWQDEGPLREFLETQVQLKDRIVSVALQQARFDARYASLFQRMLWGVVITRDIDAAQDLLAWLCVREVSSTHEPLFTRVVTLQGEVLHRDGWLSGGGKEEGQQGLLVFERELSELPPQLSEQVALLNQLNSRMSELQRVQDGRRAEQVALDKELQRYVGRISELNKTLLGMQREQERVQTEVRLAASVEQQLMAEIVGLEQEVQAAQERVRTHEQSQREMVGLVEELQAEMEERASIYRRQQDELGRARTALAVKRQEAKSLRQQLTAQQAQAQDVQMQVGQLVERKKAAEEQQQAVQEALMQQRGELELARDQARTATERLHQVEVQANEVDQQIAALEKTTTQMHAAMTNVEHEYRRCLLESQKARDAVESLLEQMREELGMLDTQELRVYVAEAEQTSATADTAEDVNSLSEEEEGRLRKLRRHVDGLRSRLKAMGGCDPAAPQQYEETRTRYEFLSTQIADMEQAALSLRAIIGQLDVTMAHQFEATFQAVNGRFREHFTTLFNGGNARLELTTGKGGEEDSSTQGVSSMAAGVEVIVQPPGKKVQDLSLLSGGERALVSAALLFALLEMNPPPFCLLDEVDAALDESNVARFCEILKRLAQRTQFIVITHNRVTMTAAQVIYGISMGGDSISRLLSLKLEEAPVAGDR